jgi:predicted ester cyclase
VTIEPTTIERNKDHVRSFFERVWNQQDLDYIDELYSPDFVLRALWQNLSLGSSGEAGKDEAKQVIGRWLEGFPDMHVTVEEQLGDDEFVVSRHFATATHTAPFRGIQPSGKQATMSGLTITRVRDDKVIEAWTLWDAVGMMQGLGIMPPKLRIMAIAQRLGFLERLQRRHQA